MTTYTWDAQDYRQNSTAQQQWALELLEKLALSGTEAVLDLGCGDGKVTAEIARRVRHGVVVGVDNSSAMLALASQHYPASDYPNLTFKQMDARNLAFDTPFDVVFSNAVLHWVTNHKSVLAGLYKSLKPRGKILLQIGAKDGVSAYLAALDQILGLPEWQGYFQGFEFPYGFMGIEEYEAWLPEAGFRSKRLALVTKDAVHADKEKFKGWIRTTWLPYTERVPAVKKERFIELIAAKYLEANPVDAAGQVHVPMVRLEVEAEKRR